MDFWMLKTPSYGDFFRARLRRAHMDFWVPHTPHMEIPRGHPPTPPGGVKG